MFGGLAIGCGIMSALVGVAAWRGRRVGSEPRCRRCGFDLSGHTPAPARCSECGAALDAPRAVRLGLRRRSWALAILAVVCLAGSGLLGLRALQGTNWLQVAPTWWLVRVEYGRSGWPHRREISAEMTERLQDGKVTLDELVPMFGLLLEEGERAAAALDAGNVPAAGSWDEEAAGHFLDAAAAGLVAKGDVDRFILQSVDVKVAGGNTRKARLAAPHLEVRTSRTRPLGAMSGDSPTVEVRVVEVRVGGEPMPDSRSRSPFEANPNTSLAVGMPSRRVEGNEPSVDVEVDYVIDLGGLERRGTARTSVALRDHDAVIDAAQVREDLRALLVVRSVRRVGADRIDVTAERRQGSVSDAGRVYLLGGKQAVEPFSSTETFQGPTSPRVVTWQFKWPVDAPVEGPLRLRFTGASLRTPIDGYAGWVEIDPLDIELPAAVDAAEEPDPVPVTP